MPQAFHSDQDVIEAKDEEIKRWREYDAFEEVEENDQYVISMRWIVTEKDNGKVKARLIVRGFEEEVVPQSDSPTASKESTKLFLAICANENFQVKSLDVTSAFLQGRPLERDVFVNPPSEVKRDGYIWKLKKTCYGLYDASRSWYFAVKEEVEKIGMKALSGDSSFFYLVRNEKLLGIPTYF